MKLDHTKPVTVPKFTGPMKWLIVETRADPSIFTGGGLPVVVDLRIHPTQLEGVNHELFSDWIELNNIPIQFIEQEGE